MCDGHSTADVGIVAHLDVVVGDTGPRLALGKRLALNIGRGRTLHVAIQTDVEQVASQGGCETGDDQTGDRGRRARRQKGESSEGETGDDGLGVHCDG